VSKIISRTLPEFSVGRQETTVAGPSLPWQLHRIDFGPVIEAGGLAYVDGFHFRQMKTSFSLAGEVQPPQHAEREVSEPLLDPLEFKWSDDEWIAAKAAREFSSELTWPDADT